MFRFYIKSGKKLIPSSPHFTEWVKQIGKKPFYTLAEMELLSLPQSKMQRIRKCRQGTVVTVFQKLSGNTDLVVKRLTDEEVAGLTTIDSELIQQKMRLNNIEAEFRRMNSELWDEYVELQAQHKRSKNRRTEIYKK